LCYIRRVAAGAEPPGLLPRALTLRDLVLLKIAAIVNVSFIPAVAIYGRASLALWLLAFVAFFLPESIAVTALARRFPGEGGVYLWTRRQFGDVHGFLSGWCYWTNNLFYIPMQLVYTAGVLAYVGGSGTAGLLNEKWFVSVVAFGWLAIAVVTNVRGLAVGKWVHNAGAFGTAMTVALVLLAVGLTRPAGGGPPTPLVTGVSWEMLSGFSVMCFAFIGVELASTMGDEIHDPGRNLPRAIVVAGVVTLGSYLALTAALQALVPTPEIGVIQGLMQAVDRGAADTGAAWLVTPVALVMAVSIGGGASAWFAGSSRVPFVAGINRALPPSLGRVHPRWGSPHVALLTHAALSAILIACALVGSSVPEAYQVLLKAAVVIQLVPFVYMFVGLVRLDGVSRPMKAAGLAGCLSSVVGIGAAFIPAAGVTSVVVFEIKMLVGCLVPIGLGFLLFLPWQRSPSAGADLQVVESAGQRIDTSPDRQMTESLDQYARADTRDEHVCGAATR
jgi:amino acid transporter